MLNRDMCNDLRTYSHSLNPRYESLRYPRSLYRRSLTVRQPSVYVARTMLDTSPPHARNGQAEQAIRSVAFVSLGCPKNLVDSERMLGLLAQDGLAITPDAAEADAIVINTCGFLEASKDESLDEIRDAIELKTDGQVQARRRRRLPGAAAQDQAARRRARRSIGWSASSIASTSSKRSAGRRTRGRSTGISSASITTCRRNWRQAQGCQLPGSKETKTNRAARLRRRPRPPASHPAPLRLPAHERRVQPGLHLLHDPVDPRADAVQADRADPRSKPRSSPPTARSS